MSCEGVQESGDDEDGKGDAGVLGDGEEVLGEEQGNPTDEERDCCHAGKDHGDTLDECGDSIKWGLVVTRLGIPPSAAGEQQRKGGDDDE